MRSKMFWILPLAFIAMGLVYVFLKPGYNAPGMEIPPPSYAAPEGWAALPDPVPPPVWKAGWKIDVIVLGKDQRLAARNAAALDRLTTDAAKQASAFTEDLAGVGPVYAPFYREVGEADDLERALNTYFDTYNNGRAFVIVTESALPVSAFARLEQDQDLKDRFGGFVTLRNIDTPLSAPIADQYCSQRPDADLACTQALATKREKGLKRLDPAVATTLFATLPAYLNANVSPLAEPLGALEEIEIIEIRRPGDDIVEQQTPQAD